MKIAAIAERWAIARPFTIARGSKNTARVVVATVTAGVFQGRGECVPYPRYGQSVAGVVAQINAFSGPFERNALLAAMPAGPARNAIDCALWDLEAKKSGEPTWQRAAVPQPKSVTTAFTLSLDTPARMGEQASAERRRRLLKIKLGASEDGAASADIERLLTVRRNAPDARLIVDANEGWTFGTLVEFAPVAAAAGVELIEQPLPANADHQLADFRSPVPIAADESIGDGANLAALAERYQAVNIKLDKTGGLTHALRLARQAQSLGLDIMVGCMVSTSLAMAPALLLTSFARVVDLDGPLLLKKDRFPGLEYNGDSVSMHTAVWG